MRNFSVIDKACNYAARIEHEYYFDKFEWAYKHFLCVVDANNSEYNSMEWNVTLVDNESGEVKMLVSSTDFNLE